MRSAHPFVPKTKEKAIVPMRFLVVKIVVSRGVAPTPPAARGKPPRKYLETEMTNHIGECGPEKEDQQSEWVNRDKEGQNDKNAGLH
jgi:hypothetical protein